MHKILSIISLIVLFGSFSLKAQVDNYALKFNSEGYVSFGTINELNGLSTYTIQFWMNPSLWTQGATILNRDNTFSIKLGVEGELIFIIGQESVSVNSSALITNNWVHVSLINAEFNLQMQQNSD